MAAFEKQLEIIANKAELKKWVDDLPDEAVGLVLVTLPPSVHEEGCGEEHESFKYYEIGEVTLERCLWMTKSFEHWIFGDIRP